MFRVLNLLVILSVLWCGLHLMEPAGTAPGLIDSHEVARDTAPGDCQDDGGAGSSAHSSHHHCPVAPEPRLAVAAEMIPAGDRVFFARRTAPLPSLAQAPPLEPPAA